MPEMKKSFVNKSLILGREFFAVSFEPGSKLKR